MTYEERANMDMEFKNIVHDYIRCGTLKDCINCNAFKYIPNTKLRYCDYLYSFRAYITEEQSRFKEYIVRTLIEPLKTMKLISFDEYLETKGENRND